MGDERESERDNSDLAASMEKNTNPDDPPVPACPPLDPRQVLLRIEPVPGSPVLPGDAFRALRLELDELRTNHERMLDELQSKLDSVNAETNGLKERTCALEVKEVRAVYVKSLVLGGDELDELRSDLQGKLDLLIAENNGLKERLGALEAKELGRTDMRTDMRLEVGEEAKPVSRKRSVLERALSRFSDEDYMYETQEHELAESMWDACLFLGCKDEYRVVGESMHVGAAVTIFGVIALLINALIQAAITAVVVRLPYRHQDCAHRCHICAGIGQVLKMSDNADITDDTAADLRCA
jgi:hypothetical protein